MWVLGQCRRMRPIRRLSSLRTSTPDGVLPGRRENHRNWSTRRRIIDMDRQEAALIIVGVPLRGFLVAVHNIDRVVDVQDNRPGWLLVTPAPDIDQGVGQADDLA